MLRIRYGSVSVFPFVNAPAFARVRGFSKPAQNKRVVRRQPSESELTEEVGCQNGNKPGRTPDHGPGYAPACVCVRFSFTFQWDLQYKSVVKTFFPVATLFSFLIANTASAIDCVWLGPVSNDWNTAANWSSGTVPGYEDSVFFAQSNQTQVSVTSSSFADNLTFESNASAYEIDVAGDILIGMGINGRVSGIQNLSGVTQNFVCQSDSTGGGGLIFLYGNAGVLSTFTTEPARTLGGFPGEVWPYVDDGQRGQTTAGSCTFINQGGIIDGGSGGVLSFHNGASGDHATIVNQAATVSGAGGGLTIFNSNCAPDQATITNEGAQVAGAGGGVSQISGSARAVGATLIALGGSNGGDGGTIQFQYSSNGFGARVEVFGNGTLDVQIDSLTIGSLEGDGLVLGEGNQLTIGDNNLSTTFSGSIQDASSVTKLGTGTLTLEGVSTYTAGPLSPRAHL